MKKYSGYTLIELIVVIAVAGVLLGIGLPQMKVYFQGNRMVTNVNGLVASFGLARSEAAKRGVRVTVCKSSTGNTASPACSTSDNWQDGWLVFVEDATGAARGTVGKYEAASGDVLIKVQGAVEGDNVTITPNNISDSSLNNFVSFTSRSVPKTSGGTTQSGVFSICDKRGMKNSSGNVIARGVVLSASGRVRSTKDENKIVACL